MVTAPTTNRSRYMLRVAAAITGNDPWACGWAEYHGTRGSLQSRMARIKRNHGGNVITQWYHHGQPCDSPL